jgi:hypothetical protein
MRILRYTALAATLALSACGGGAAADLADDRQKALDAGLKFAQCMRENGVDMPDPQIDEGGFKTQLDGPSSGRKPSRRTMDAADAKCRKYLDRGRPANLSPEKEAEMRRQALAHSRCMREHGIDGFPDPQFSEGGGMEMRLDSRNGLDPRSPKFQSAEKACGMPFGKGKPGAGFGVTSEASK